MISIPVIDWSLLSLEILITTFLVFLMVVDILVPRHSKQDYIGLLSLGGLTALIGFWLTQGGLSGNTCGGIFVMDSLAWYFKLFFLTAMVFVLGMSRHFFKSLPQRKNEFYLLLWLALLGMCLTASSADFLLLFISIEILTISLYVMTAYLKSDKHSLEAGMKYLILGSMTSGFFLYGVSFLYGAAHSTLFSAVHAHVSTNPIDPMMLFGLVMVFAAVGFKIASVPFQFWVPDVYQGAPTPVTALLSVGSKAAGFVILIRLFMEIFVAWHLPLSLGLAVLSAATMCYGNLAAMAQTNIKRLLGYSSIGHAGYLLMGAAAGSVLGISSMNFYLLGYLFTNLAAFSVIILFFVAQKSDEIEDYTGLARRSSLMAAVLLLALASLAGVPPLAGFFGKFGLLMATVQAGFWWLALIAAGNIVVSLYYYMKVARVLYADRPAHSSPIPVPTSMRLLLWVAAIAMIGIGVFQGPFLTAAIAAVAGMHF